jgi:hypothetical protein
MRDIGVTALAAVAMVSSTVSSAEAQVAGDITGFVRYSLNNEALLNALVSIVGESSFRTLKDEFGGFTLVNVLEVTHTMRVEGLRTMSSRRSSRAQARSRCSWRTSSSSTQVQLKPFTPRGFRASANLSSDR